MIILHNSGNEAHDNHMHEMAQIVSDTAFSHDSELRPETSPAVEYHTLPRYL